MKALIQFNLSAFGGGVGADAGAGGEFNLSLQSIRKGDRRDGGPYIRGAPVYELLSYP